MIIILVRNVELSDGLISIALEYVPAVMVIGL